ncbi:recombinase family protein [Nocardiopsis sp. RSe5-2]|uniref:Recombinase family protein n=1 Tax=Nocardiopsis endophytica TaxID=3018445 RepID=A0ABT4U4G3_9ACTN|nr:recombinase family protein [Nocardiopsis endophytica]MDA2811841.1 recombinase family protein [Nocardiopsis endophytica]
MVKRVVKVARLSKHRHESASVERQLSKGQAWADLNDAVVAGQAVDVDVSGDVPPWERPELGEWLKRPEDFDVLTFWKLDRLARSLKGFVDFLEWAEKNEVELVFLDDRIDLTSDMGQLLAKILAAFAEFELKTIKGRTQDGINAVIQSGRWKGGIPPYGYRPVKEVRNEVYGWYLVKDTESQTDTASRVLELVRRVVDDHEAVARIRDDFTERGVPTSSDAHRIRMGKEPKGAKWTTSQIIKVLRSRALLGEYETHSGETTRNAQTGMVVQKAEPLIAPSRWNDLQECLDRASRKKTQNRKGGSMLAQVAMCDVCSRPLHHFQSGTRPYYRCSSYSLPEGRCANKMVRSGTIEKAVSDYVIFLVGDLEKKERVVVPGIDYSRDIASVDEALENLIGNMTTLKPGSRAADAARKQIEELEKRREALEALPTRPEEIKFVGTGVTAGDSWNAMTYQEKGAFLRNHDFKVWFRDTNQTSHPEPAFRFSGRDLEELYTQATGIDPGSPEAEDWALRVELASEGTTRITGVPMEEIDFQASPEQRQQQSAEWQAKNPHRYDPFLEQATPATGTHAPDA